MQWHDAGYRAAGTGDQAVGMGMGRHGPQVGSGPSKQLASTGGRSLDTEA